MNPPPPRHPSPRQTNSGKKGNYIRENLVGPFLVHQLLPPPPPPSTTSLGQVPSRNSLDTTQHTHTHTHTHAEGGQGPYHIVHPILLWKPAHLICNLQNCLRLIFCSAVTGPSNRRREAPLEPLACKRASPQESTPHDMLHHQCVGARFHFPFIFGEWIFKSRLGKLLEQNPQRHP